MSQPWPLAPIPDTAPAFGDPLDLLHRAFDGGLPRRARLAALVGGEGAWAARRRDAHALLAARACADAVQAVA